MLHFFWGLPFLVLVVLVCGLPQQHVRAKCTAFEAASMACLRRCGVTEIFQLAFPSVLQAARKFS